MRYFGLRSQKTSVTCPRCGDGTLAARRSCLQVSFPCGACGTVFLLEDLARVQDDETFAALAEVVGDRFSDRV